MAVRTGVDVVTQIIDQTAAGSASVQRSLSDLNTQASRSGTAGGAAYGNNFIAGLGKAVASAGGVLAVLEGLNRGEEAYRTGVGIGYSIAEGIAAALRGLPIVGDAGNTLATYIGRGYNRVLGSGTWTAPGESDGTYERGRDATQEMQQRQRRQDQFREKEREARERILQKNAEDIAVQQERQRLERQEQEDRRQLEQERRESEQRRERERREAEEERLAAEQQREAERLAAEQARRDGSVAGAEGRLAGVTDSRGLSGRASAFLQGRSQTQLQQDTVSALRRLIDVNLKQLEEMQQTRFQVVGN